MAPEIRRGAPPHRLGSLARQPGARGPRAGRARLWRRGGGGGHTALARRAARARASKGEIPQDQPRSHPRVGVLRVSREQEESGLDSEFGLKAYRRNNDVLQRCRTVSALLRENGVSAPVRVVLVSE